jgi:hypothetical protein
MLKNDDNMWYIQETTKIRVKRQTRSFDITSPNAF